MKLEFEIDEKKLNEDFREKLLEDIVKSCSYDLDRDRVSNYTRHEIKHAVEKVFNSWLDRHQDEVNQMIKEAVERHMGNSLKMPNGKLRKAFEKVMAEMEATE